MAENEGGDSRTVSAFFMGFVVGCLLCLGAGGTFFWTQNRRLAEAEMESRMRAEEAERHAEDARRMAEMAAEAERRARMAAEAERAAAVRAQKKKGE